jgi:uncharacterized DUF497 family protein
MRFTFDKRKSAQLRRNPKRNIGFEEAQEIWEHPYYEDRRTDDPDQYRVIGWVEGKLYSLIFKIREDKEGEYYHLVTLWKSTYQEEKLYEENIK